MRKKAPTRGAKKGERRGGRSAGTPNKATLERIERARLEVENARGAGKKLGKEVLEDFMHLFAGMAAAYQPLPPGTIAPPGREPDEGRFLTYAKLAVDAAKELASFQSPRLKAIMVSMPPDQPPARTIDADNVVRLNDPAAVARVYQQMVKRIG